jgi:hypothetical protein
MCSFAEASSAFPLLRVKAPADCAPGLQTMGKAFIRLTAQRIAFGAGVDKSIQFEVADRHVRRNGLVMADWYRR